MSYNLLGFAFVTCSLVPYPKGYRQEFVWFFFIISVSLVSVSFGSLVLFRISLNHVSVLSCRLLTFFETATFDFLLAKSQSSMPLGSIIGELFSLGDEMFLFFMFLEALCCCSCI